MAEVAPEETVEAVTEAPEVVAAVEADAVPEAVAEAPPVDEPAEGEASAPDETEDEEKA